MYRVKIERQDSKYFVFYEDKLLLYALNKGNYYQQHIAFYDSNNNIVATAKRFIILFFMSSYKIVFSDNQIVYMKGNAKTSSFEYRETEYCIEHRSKKKGDLLFKNKNLEGKLFEISEGVSVYEKEMFVDLLEDSISFSIITILFSDFDVN